MAIVHCNKYLSYLGQNINQLGIHMSKNDDTWKWMLKWMCKYCKHTLKGKIKSYIIRVKLDVAPIKDMMREIQLQWFRHFSSKISWWSSKDVREYDHWRGNCELERSY